MKPLISFLLALLSGAICFAQDDTYQNTYDALARTRLLRVHDRIAKAVEVLVYLLDGDLKKETPADSNTFPIRPNGLHAMIKAKHVLRGSELGLLIEAWADLAKQKDYVEAMCHYPVYGLRFRDDAGAVILETSLCWECSNFYLQEDGEGDYTWAPLPKSYLADSKLKKQLDGLFRRNGN